MLIFCIGIVKIERWLALSVMEDFSEQSRFDDNQIGYDGEEQFQEQYEQPQEQQFDSGREFEGNHNNSNNNVDSEGNEFRDSSFSSRADAAAGLVRL